jgi:hypothetical protein
VCNNVSCYVCLRSMQCHSYVTVSPWPRRMPCATQNALWRLWRHTASVAHAASGRHLHWSTARCSNIRCAAVPDPPAAVVAASSACSGAGSRSGCGTAHKKLRLTFFLKNKRFWGGGLFINLEKKMFLNKPEKLVSSWGRESYLTALLDGSAREF